MATEDGRKQTKVKRDKPIIEGTTGDFGDGRQRNETKSRQTISELEQGLTQFIEETHEHAFAIQKMAFILMEKSRQYAKELERIKAQSKDA